MDKDEIAKLHDSAVRAEVVEGHARIVVSTSAIRALTQEVLHYRESHTQPLMVPCYDDKGATIGWKLHPDRLPVRKPTAGKKKGKRK